MRRQKGSSGAQLRAATTATPDPPIPPPPPSQSKLRGWVVSGGKCNAGSKLKVNFSFHGRAFVWRIIRSSFRAKSRRISAPGSRPPTSSSSISSFFARCSTALALVHICASLFAQAFPLGLSFARLSVAGQLCDNAINASIPNALSAICG